jgi:protein TonB
MKAVIFSICVAAFLLPISVRADRTPPVPVRTVPPEFPYELRRTGVSGVVLVSCEIDETGTVQNMKVIKSTNDAFVEPAMNALKKWKFKPAQENGSNIAVRVSIPIKFTIHDD